MAQKICCNKISNGINVGLKDSELEMSISIGPQSFLAVVLPLDADLSLVIKFINDMQLSFTDEKRKEFWKKYTQTITIPENTQ